jgi:hypothetical protein
LQVSGLSEQTMHGAVPIPADQAGYLLATAARAPSLHNSQPWRFRINRFDIELLADPGRKLGIDPLGREMLLSCGAALFGLRLAVRSLGYLPVVELNPDPGRLRLLARVSARPGTPMTALERTLLDALPHRHTHRGPFVAGPLPAGLLAGLQHDALAEGAMLAVVDRPIAFRRLADVVATAGRRQDLDPVARAEVLRWSRPAGSQARDGVPAHAFPAQQGDEHGRLAQRDFDLGRGLGLLAADGGAPAATAVLLTAGDVRADWVRAGQALHRVLAHAASKWVFASLHTQPLESVVIRDLIRSRLALPGVPQLLLQLGHAHVSQSTGRRPPAELMEP